MISHTCGSSKRSRRRFGLAGGSSVSAQTTHIIFTFPCTVSAQAIAGSRFSGLRSMAEKTRLRREQENAAVLRNDPAALARREKRVKRRRKNKRAIHKANIAAYGAAQEVVPSLRIGGWLPDAFARCPRPNMCIHFCVLKCRGNVVEDWGGEI